MKRRTFLSLAAAVALPGCSRGDDGSGRLESPDSATTEGFGHVAVASFGEKVSDYGSGVDAALCSLTGLSARDAWSRLFRPEDRIAIKLNCLAPRLSPRIEIIEALIRGIESAGVPSSQIVLFERTSRELERAGFNIQRGETEVRCFGTDALQGSGYGFSILEHRSIGSLFSSILTDYATALVNVGVCKDHDLSGVSAGCKNLYGLIHNPNRYHDNRCDPYLADLVDHPAVRAKLRLTVIDAIEGQCHGGPAFSPSYLFRPGKILIARDPIAVDRIAWELIENERARRGLATLTELERQPSWIETGSRLGLGQADRERIVLHEVEA